MNRRSPNEWSSQYTQLQRWNEIAEGLGYKKGFKLFVDCDGLEEFFDHGGMVTRQDGQNVLFGDLYPHIWDEAAAFAEEYGLELTILPGLWNPGVSKLHLYRVVDPVKALRIYKNTVLDRNSVYARPVSKYMPVGTNMAAVKAEFEKDIRSRLR
ncbi:hypothetical protein [Acinetobacter baumannii]|uniref:hypothetical protein n=1 Tax=Acinetobacter baumannii TaxID=470 RepID=UPI003B42C650